MKKILAVLALTVVTGVFGFNTPADAAAHVHCKVLSVTYDEVPDGVIYNSDGTSETRSKTVSIVTSRCRGRIVTKTVNGYVAPPVRGVR